MPELLADVGDGRTVLEQQRRVGVPQIVNPNLALLGLLEHTLEYMPEVPFLERRSPEPLPTARPRVAARRPVVVEHQGLIEGLVILDAT